MKVAKNLQIALVSTGVRKCQTLVSYLLSESAEGGNRTLTPLQAQDFKV